MTNPFIRKLEGHVPLSTEHRQALESLVARPHAFGPREMIYRDDDQLTDVNVVLKGWVCRSKILPDGRRQIISLFLPGDMCDPYVFLLGSLNHTIGTLTPAMVAKLPAWSIRSLTAGSPELAEAFWWQMMTAAEIQREWTVNLGRRTALERLGHFFCEIIERLHQVGLSDGHGCDMPLTQTDLADLCGLSTVHVNRSIQELRSGGLIDLRAKRLTLNDRQALVDLAMFDPAYLHSRRA